MSARTCSIEGCGRPHNAGGLCSAHGDRLRRTGSVRPDMPIVTRRTECEVPGCEKKHSCRGLCDMHYQRLRRAGNLELLPIYYPAGAEARAWKGNQVGYPAAHHRVRRLRGSASLHLCRNCGNTASDWAYTCGDDQEITCEETGRRYSGSAEFYAPLCRPCHKRIDNAARRGDFTFATEVMGFRAPAEPEPAYFTHVHPLTSRVKAACDHPTRPMVGGVGCGQCWERAIRDDELNRISTGQGVSA